MTGRRSWIVVADRRKARVFFHRAPGEPLAAANPSELAFEPAKEPADRPTRVHDRTGPSRHGVDAGTDLDHADREIAGRAIVAALEEGRKADAFDRFVLVAPPDMLGAIRPHLSAAMRERLVGEVGSRLIDLDARELGTRLTEADLIGRVAG